VEFNLFNAKKIIGPKEFPGYVQIPIGIGSRRTYIDAFSDTYQATLKLQDKNLVYSEFFVVWMELKLKCENSHNLIKKKLSAQIKIRESKLLENEALLAAIYMDPRVNCMLTNYQKSLAKTNLKKIAFRLFELKQLSLYVVECLNFGSCFVYVVILRNYVNN